MSSVRTVRRADGPVVADVVVPPSKSIANRALICAALAAGESEITGLAPGDDTNAMIACLSALSIPVALDDRNGVLIGNVTGTGGVLPLGPVQLDTRLAGTTSRFITALAALGPGPYTIDGEPPLRARPMGPLHDSLHSLGARVEPTDDWGHLPVTVSGPVGGADAIVMPGDVSSQYVTALMLIAPMIRGGISLGLSTDLVSRPYVDITKSVMAAFGATDVSVGERHITVAAGAYLATDYTVEPDASSASYPLAAAAIAGGGGEREGAGPQLVAGRCDLL